MTAEFLYDTTVVNTGVMAASYIASFILGLALGWKVFKKGYKKKEVQEDE